MTFLSLYFDDPKWKNESEAEFFFFDRAFLENLVIAEYRRDQGDLSEDEFAVLCKLARGIESLMPRNMSISTARYRPCSAICESAGETMRTSWI